MRIRRISVIVLFSLGLFSLSAFSAETNGWIKTDTCWVVKKPTKDAKIVGIILKGAAVAVEDIGKGWAKIVHAPIRDPKTQKYVECEGCYIEIKNFTTERPFRGRW